MKTLSLIQPWASLVALGAKGIETRSWPTSYRGPLAIHASKSFAKWARDLCRENPFYAALSAVMTFRKGLPFYNGYTDVELEEPEKYLPLGCIVAVCDLVDVVRIGDAWNTMAMIWAHHLCEGVSHADASARYRQELAFGDYAPGRYAWLLKNVVALDKPIPTRGMLGLWDYEMEDPRGETSHVR